MFITEIAHILSPAIGLTFAYAALAKWRDMDAFLSAFSSYRLIPNRFVKGAGLLLIGIEALIAVAHVGWIALTIAIPVTLLLLASFLFFTLKVLKNGLELDCLCFGARQGERISMRTVARLSLLTLAEGILFYHMAFASSVGAGRPPAPQSQPLAILAAIFLIVLVSWCLVVPEIRVIAREYFWSMRVRRAWRTNNVR